MPGLLQSLLRIMSGLLQSLLRVMHGLLQSLLRIMQELMAVWLICVLAGTSCAVFYTKSSDNDYPRIGRRAFFTGGVKGSNYPRIGRSSPGFGTDDVMSGYGGHFLSQSKRGLFTAGDRGFPRIGRGEGGRQANHELSARCCCDVSGKPGCAGIGGAGAF